MALSLRRQIVDAYNARAKRDGMTLEELNRLAGFVFTTDSLSRKLRGLQSIRAEEIEALALALRVEVRAGRREAA